MRRSMNAARALSLAILAVRAAPVVAADWTKTFEVDTSALATVGESPYFVLRPGHRLTLEGREHGKAVQLVVTVLDETRRVGGVETRVVEERESSAGVLREVSRNYFAIDPRTKDIYYFGEDVDEYDGKGKLSGHGGGWHHGADGARFGLMVAGAPAVGSRYYQEQAPGRALDRAEVLSVTERLSTPAGAFEGCLRTRETTPLEPFAKEYKVYAPGVGLIQDGPLVLVARSSS